MKLLRRAGALVLLSLAAVAGAASDKHPLPNCPTCPKAEDLQAPGVGFVLGMSYGTVAIKFPNGLIHPVARVPGSAEYQQQMHRLATQPPARMPDGRRWPHEVESQWQLLMHVLRRWANRNLLARPASAEVAVWADMVWRLRLAAEAELAEHGHKNASKAILVGPDVVRITADETDDVLSFAGLGNLMRDAVDDGAYGWDNGNLFASGAAWAGLGKGLCRTYLDAEMCAIEEAKMKSKSVLFVEYTLRGLWLAADGAVTSANPSSPSTTRKWAPHTAVAGAELGFENVKDQKHWERVRLFIEAFVDKAMGAAVPPGEHGNGGAVGKFDEVVLTGESASDGRFMDAVKAALKGRVSSKGVLKPLSKDPVKDPLFLTALGAAEMARRKLEGMAPCMRTAGSCKVPGKGGHDEI